jgi:uncharacterized membrane protein
VAALFFLYPLLAHLATLLHSELLAWLALSVFFAVPMLPALLKPSRQAWLILIVIIALLTGCALTGVARYLMYIPPILIPLSVLILFARSLRAGHVPVVTRVARQIRGELPAELDRYTRTVTQCWVALLGTLAIWSLLLAIYARPEFWSLMTNLVQYLILASVFLFEYLFRRWRFRNLEHESFPTMIVALFKTRMH